MVADICDRFVEYFSPWVSIDLSSSIQRTDTLLFNTACLLASRYLPGMPANTIHEISMQVQHGVTKTLWRRSPLTNDLLQALALLCLYPTSGHKEGFMDGWLLSGLSINHGLTSFNFLNILSTKSVLTDEMLSQMRLWNTFCLTHLQYVPSRYISFTLLTMVKFCSRIRSLCQRTATSS